MEKIRYDQRYVSLREVYRTGNFSAAGNSLGLTPSAVSQQIHALERELNVELFSKGSKKLIPTQECETVVRYVERIQSLCHRMETDLEKSRFNLRHMEVGVTPSAEYFALSRVFTQYAESDDTGMQIAVHTASAQTLIRALKNYEIDLAVVEGNYTGKTLNAIILDTDFLTVAVPLDSVYAQRGMIGVEDLLREPLILKCKGSGTRDLLEAKLKTAGYPISRFHIMMETDSIDTIKKLVAGHYGLSVLSNKVCLKDVAAGKICTVPLAGMNMLRKIQLLYRKDFNRDELVKGLQNVYTEIMRELEGAPPARE